MFMAVFPGNKRDTHFTTEDLKSLGYHVCDTLLDFCDPDRTKVKMGFQEVWWCHDCDQFLMGPKSAQWDFRWSLFALSIFLKPLWSKTIRKAQPAHSREMVRPQFTKVIEAIVPASLQHFSPSRPGVQAYPWEHPFLIPFLLFQKTGCPLSSPKLTLPFAHLPSSPTTSLRSCLINNLPSFLYPQFFPPLPLNWKCSQGASTFIPLALFLLQVISISPHRSYS